MQWLVVVRALIETIRDVKEVPSGHLYAGVMEYMSLETYEGLIAMLKRNGMVTESSSHLLTWTAK